MFHNDTARRSGRKERRANRRTRRLAVEKFEDRVSLPMIKDSVSRMTAGSASNFIPTREGGMVVYLKARIPASEQKLTDEFPAFLEEVRESRESSAFGEWFSQQVNAAGLNTQPANPRGGR